MKSLEQQLTEMDAENRELRRKAGKSGASTSVAQLLSDSGLPPASQSRLRKRIPLNEKADVVKAAITEEKEYIRKLGHQGTQDQRDAWELPVSELGARLRESYVALGLSANEAKIAADIDTAVTSVTESRQRLTDAAKSLGMSDAEAAVFSDI